MSRQIVLDTETTGLSPADGDRLVEIGCVELLERRLTGRHLHIYLNPERDSSEEALRIHGLTSAFLADKPKFRDVAQQLIDFVQDAEVIIHNAAFDVGFLDMELNRVGRPAFSSHVALVTDTLLMAKQMYPGKRNSLDALCDRLDVDNSGRTLHGALLDAELLADVYINMTRGQEALAIDADDTQPGTAVGGAHVDLSGFALPILHASEAERAAHDGVLADIDRSSGGKTIWRAAEQAA